MPEPGANLYLVGFMGTGKTTVGRAVAMRLGFQAMDSDHEIEREKGRPLARRTPVFTSAGFDTEVGVRVFFTMPLATNASGVTSSPAANA